MKNPSFFVRVFSKSALVGGLALVIAAAMPVFAADSTNSGAAVVTNESSGAAAVKLATKETGGGTAPGQGISLLSQEQVKQLLEQKNDSDGPGRWAEVFLPLGMFAMITVLVGLGLANKLQRNKILHETIRLMIEKGQPIPPELLHPTAPPRRRSRVDLYGGLVLVGVGLSLFILLGSLSGIPHGVIAVGAVPFLIGVALLVARKLDSNQNTETR